MSIFKRVSACLFFFTLFFLAFPQVRVAHAVDGEITYTGTNTDLVGDDNYKGPFNLGFTFTFFGTNYTQAYVNINGTLNFSAGDSSYSNSALNVSGQNNTIFAFWDDLITDIPPYDQKPIYYATIGSAPNRKFIVQWTNVYFYSTTIQMGTFQAILYEGSNNIQIQYRDLLGGDRALGNSATIGIKKDSSTYKQYSANTLSLAQGQSILYTPNGSNDYTVTSQTPGVGQEVSAGYDLVYLAPAGAPTSPTLVNPTDGTTGVTTTPTFEWLPVDGATSYTVLISTVSNFSSTVVNQSGITGVSYTLGSALNTSATYYWRVQAVNNVGSSLSSTRSFVTGAANAAPTTPSSVASSTLIGGGNVETVTGSTLTATLADSDSGQEVRYRVQIATDNSFSNLVVDYRSPFAAQGGVTYTVGQSGGTYLVGSTSTTFSAGNYYLRIRTEDDAAASSSWYTASGIAFVVPADTTSPTISSIVATPGTTSATITWSTSEAASTQVQYGLLPAYGLQTAETNTSPRVTSHSVSLSSLQSCARYFFRVLSTDAATNQATSSAQTFNTTGCESSSILTGSESSIATSGGQLAFASGRTNARLTLPSSFYSQNVRVQLNRLDSSGAATPPTGRVLSENNFFDLVAVSESNERVTTFDQPVTFVVEYGSDVEETFDETTLDVYKFTSGSWVAQNCTLDTAANTLTCSLPGFSVYGVLGQAKGSGSQSSTQGTTSTTTTVGEPACAVLPPIGIPAVYQIDTTPTTAQLYFTPVGGNTTGYVIEYGLADKSIEHAIAFDHTDQGGAVTHTIKELLPNQNWHFRVRAKNGCAYGAWSVARVAFSGVVPLSPTSDAEQDFVTAEVVATKSSQLSEVKNETKTPLSKKPSNTPTPKSDSQRRINLKISLEPIRKLWGNITNTTAKLGAASKTTLSELERTTASSIGKFPDIKTQLASDLSQARFAVHEALVPTQSQLAKNSSRFGANLAATIDIWFDVHPTTITNLKVAEVGREYAVITWQTNHYATSKVSFGDSHDYGSDVQDLTKTREHRIKIEGLEPGRTYYYEVMSHGVTYAYDARHEFVTAQ